MESFELAGTYIIELKSNQTTVSRPATLAGQVDNDGHVMEVHIPTFMEHGCIDHHTFTLLDYEAKIQLNSNKILF